MSAFRPGKTWSGPRVMSYLLLLVLLTVLAGPVLCQDESDIPTDGPADEDATTFSEAPAFSDVTPTQESSITSSPTTESNGTPDPSGVDPPEDDGGSSGDGWDGTEDPLAPEEELSPTIILVPVVLVVVIIGMVVGGIVINRRCNRKTGDVDLGKADPYLDGNSTEKVPMPMFEEDVPSVLELEMEDLDEWMNKDGGAGIESDHI